RARARGRPHPDRAEVRMGAGFLGAALRVRARDRDDRARAHRRPRVLTRGADDGDRHPPAPWRGDIPGPGADAEPDAIALARIDPDAASSERARTARHAR